MLGLETPTNTPIFVFPLDVGGQFTGPPKVPRREMHAVSESDVNIFLEDIHKSPYNALFYMDLFTGMRRSELLAIQWKSVDLKLCLISVNRTMHVYLPAVIKGRSFSSSQRPANHAAL